MWIIQNKWSDYDWESEPEVFTNYANALQELIRLRSFCPSYLKYRLLKCEVLDD